VNSQRGRSCGFSAASAKQAEKFRFATQRDCAAGIENGSRIGHLNVDPTDCLGQSEFFNLIQIICPFISDDKCGGFSFP
jgi:hypothetical protein